MNYRFWALTGLLLICLSLPCMADEGQNNSSEKNLGGWEKGSPYNKLYNLNEVDAFKATVVGFKTESPMPGMSEAVVMLVRESDDDEIISVQVCPLWYAKPQRIGVRKGDLVKIRGAWAEIGGKEVVMAAKIKKSEHNEFKVRLTSDGTPFWTLSPEQLAKEAASQ